MPVGLFAKRRQSPIRLIGAGGEVDLSQAADRFVCQESSSVDPQQFAEGSGVASISDLVNALIGRFRVLVVSRLTVWFTPSAP